MLLGDNVLYFFGWVDQAHDQLDVTLDSCREDDWLTLLIEICEKIL